MRTTTFKPEAEMPLLGRQFDSLLETLDDVVGLKSFRFECPPCGQG